MNWAVDAKDEMAGHRGENWAMILAVATLRELDARMPGFREAVRASIAAQADEAERGGRDTLWGLRDLTESSVFIP